jgi:hypothetical protein
MAFGGCLPAGHIARVRYTIVDETRRS